MIETSHQRHILLCVAGMTPQIITETLYVLTQQRKEFVDEIRVITTLAGCDRIMSDLLDPVRGKFFEFCRDFDIDPSRIKFDRTCIYLLSKQDGMMLEDIRSVADNEIAADQICEIVRQLASQPGTRLHASAAGGRKTMSIYLTTAMQLFGRTNDRLSHVLVSEEFETNPNFFYKPPVPRILERTDRRTGKTMQLSTEGAEIHLADIPFIRLRDLVRGGPSGECLPYREMVGQTQENLVFFESESSIHLVPARYFVSVETPGSRVPARVAQLTPREFFIYALFARYRKDAGGRGFVSLGDVKREDLVEVFRYITRARGEELGMEECSTYPGFDFLEALAERVGSLNPIDVEDVNKSFLQTFSKINRKLFRQINKKIFEDTDLSERFLIQNTGNRSSARYGLDLSPERIFFE